MRFSIITVTYNAEKYLTDTLNSVVSQEFLEFEHLIWDGGSQDRTLEIAESYPHVKIFRGKDVGISDAMNKGAALAKGEFLLHLHADDLLAHPKTLTIVDTYLKQHPEARWLYGQADVIDAKGMKKRTSPFIPFQHRRLRKYNLITHPATFISRPLFENLGGFDLSLRYCMDYDLWLRCAQVEPAYALPAVLSCFREHPGSLSTKEQVGVADEAYFVRNQYVKNFLERWRSYRTWKKRKKRITG